VGNFFRLAESGGAVRGESGHDRGRWGCVRVCPSARAGRCGAAGGGRKGQDQGDASDDTARIEATRPLRGFPTRRPATWSEKRRARA
jgi:hypothetical protein